MAANDPPPYPSDSTPGDNPPSSGSGEAGTSGLPSYGSVHPSDGGQQPPVPPPPDDPVGQAGTNKKALWSMIVGIVSLLLGLLCGFIALGGIASIILGVLARGEIAQSGGRQTGGGMAITGIVTGAVALLILLLGIVLLATGVVEMPTFPAADTN